MRKGILFAGTSYLLWGLFPLYFKLLHAIDATEILVHRVIWSLFFLGAILAWRGQWAWLSALLEKPRTILAFFLSALLLAANWLVYIWAITHDQVVDASLGYFITPLVNIVLGLFWFKERLRTAQWLSVALAGFGVLWLTVHVGRLPWIGLGLAFTFGTYGLLRKTAALGALEGLSLETLLLFPFALVYLGWLILSGHSSFIQESIGLRALLLASGPITAIPLLAFAAGARRIPMTTLGLLQYIAPMMQFLLGVLLFREPFGQEKFLGFAAIWAALVLYSMEGLWQSRGR